jgi:hypothetical protein
LWKHVQFIAQTYICKVVTSYPARFGRTEFKLHLGMYYPLIEYMTTNTYIHHHGNYFCYKAIKKLQLHIIGTVTLRYLLTKRIHDCTN